MLVPSHFNLLSHILRMNSFFFPDNLLSLICFWYFHTAWPKPFRPPVWNAYGKNAYII